MSGTVSAVFVEEFDANVHQAYQGMQLLAGRVRTKRGVVGNKVHFPVLGALRAYPKVHRAPVIPANAVWTRPEATLTDWHIADLTDVFEDIKTNVDERKQLATSFSMAMGRQEDEMIMDLMESATLTGDNETPVGGTAFQPKLDITDNTRPSKLIGSAVSAMRNRGVNRREMTTAVLPAIWEADFIADPSISSRDYGGGEAQRTGAVPQTNAVDLVFMDDRTASATDPSDLSGGFNSKGGIGYMFAMNAIGMAYGKDTTLEIGWQQLYTSWLVTVCLSLGGVLVDTKGVQKITGGPTS